MTSSLHDVIVMAAQKAKEARERPSKVTKERLSHIVEQEVIECGKIARHLCQHSGSREVRLTVCMLLPSPSARAQEWLVAFGCFFCIPGPSEVCQEDGWARGSYGEYLIGRCNIVFHNSYHQSSISYHLLIAQNLRQVERLMDRALDQ